MSIQHVLESARRLGVPVIVTDVGGRDPMVVLPLDQFEKLAEKSPAKQKQSAGWSAEREVDESMPEDIEAFTDLDPENSEIPLDERFYLEPVEDQQTDDQNQAQ